MLNLNLLSDLIFLFLANDLFVNSHRKLFNFFVGKFKIYAITNPIINGLNIPIILEKKVVITLNESIYLYTMIIPTINKNVINQILYLPVGFNQNHPFKLFL